MPRAKTTEGIATAPTPAARMVKRASAPKMNVAKTHKSNSGAEGSAQHKAVESHSRGLSRATVPWQPSGILGRLSPRSKAIETNSGSASILACKATGANDAVSAVYNKDHRVGLNVASLRGRTYRKRKSWCSHGTKVFNSSGALTCYASRAVRKTRRHVADTGRTKGRLRCTR